MPALNESDRLCSVIFLACNDIADVLDAFAWYEERREGLGLCSGTLSTLR
jgi:hypothetical protein